MHCFSYAVYGSINPVKPDLSDYGTLKKIHNLNGQHTLIFFVILVEIWFSEHYSVC